MKFLMLFIVIVAVSAEPPIPILRQESEQNYDGTYQNSFESGNGIVSHEAGSHGKVDGAVSYISPEGIPISLHYEADEYGFRAAGAHLPTSPPIPHEIVKALNYIAQHPPAPEHI